MIKENSKVIRSYKSGYEIREELWKLDENDPGTIMRQAYTPTGDYIGDTKFAHRLCSTRGIKPEKADANHCICSIGFCEKEQKWYGWSHRAIFGFGIGSQVKKGDCAFIPNNRQEYVESLKDWYSDDMYENLVIQERVRDIYISYDIIQKTTGKVMSSQRAEPLDIEYGRGEWTAQSIDDAKQMAIDFAESVS